MHRLQQSCGEKGMVWYSLKMRVLWPLLSRGEHTNPCLGALFVFLSSYTKEGFIIYYIEYCCLHFRYKEINITNAKWKGGKLIISILGKIHTDFKNYLEDRQ